MASDRNIKARAVFSYFTRHKTIANLLMIVLLVLGVIAASKIRSQFFPDVVIENINVTVSWPGAGPEEVDTAIVAVLETALLTVEGVDSSSSTATEGNARISLSFEPGWDMAQAQEDVQSAVDAVGNLPETAEPPEVRRSIWRDRVTDVMIFGPVTAEQLGRFADEFAARLYREGITRTSISGIESQTIRVILNEATLIEHGLTMRDVSTAIQQQSTTSPAGEVTGVNSRLRTGEERRTVQDLDEIVVRTEADGSKLYLSDIAQLEVNQADAGQAYFTQQMPAVLVRVDRNDRGDAIRMQTEVARIAAELEPTLPAGTQVQLINTRAEQITDRLDILFENGLMGLALVLAMLYLFLGARTAFWVAAGIPVAMFAAIAVMFAAGLTINMISLFALIITLGIVVDDAIVLGEHADFRARRLQESPAVAAENAATRMASPIFSSTITTVLAFFGLVAIGGRFGTLIADIPFTVIAVLLASLVECFLILPNHMSHALVSVAKQRWWDWPSRMFNAGFRWFRDRIFIRFMRLVVALRYPVVAGMITLLALSASIWIKGDVTWRFFSSPEQGSITGNVAMLPSATRTDTIAMVNEVERAVTVVAQAYEDEFGVYPVTHVLTQVGGTVGRGLSGQDTKDPDQLGSIDIGLIDADLRPFSSSEFLTKVQEEVRNLPLMETLSFRQWGFGPGGDSLDVSLYGADAQTLKAAAEYLKTSLARYPAVSALEDNLAYDKSELTLQLTPLGQSLGFTIDELGRNLRDRLSGIEAATFPDGNRSGSILVELAAEELTADFLTRARIMSPTGEFVQLSEIVTISESLGFSTVRRENGLRLIRVNGDISEDDPALAASITEALQTTILPDVASRFGVEWDLGGLAEQERDFLTDALVGFTLCMLGIYLTLAWIFASWTRPMVVMVVIPFGLVGTIWGHYAWDVPLSMFTVVGLIGMSGIFINDSIVLISTIQEYARSRALIPAIIDATTDRLRPLMLTTLTTVLGLAPLLYETSQQAQFLKPTVITLVYGLGFGFFVVILIVPSLVAMQLDVQRLLTSTRRAMVGRATPKGIKLAMFTLGLGLIGWGAVTVGSWVATGQVISWAQPLTERLSMLPGGLKPLIVMLAGTALILLLTLPLVRVLGRRGPNPDSETDRA